MTRLDGWLQQATQGLSKDSKAVVRAEIHEHYEVAREVAMSGGLSADEADELAVADLGDAKAANRQYREVLLTAAEARALRQGTMEARVVCARPWLKWLVLAMPAAALMGSSACFILGAVSAAWDLLVVGIGIGPLLAAPFLPIYTPSRACAFRILKWVMTVGTFGLLFGPGALKWSWLLFSCLWPLALNESTRISIRRKLPVAKWPRQLYL